MLCTKRNLFIISNAKSELKLEHPTFALGIYKRYGFEFRLRFGQPYKRPDLCSCWSVGGVLKMKDVREQNKTLDQYSSDFWIDSDINLSLMTPEQNKETINFSKVIWLSIEFKDKMHFPVYILQRHYFVGEPDE